MNSRRAFLYSAGALTTTGSIAEIVNADTEPAFKIGEQVTATTTLNVRAQAGTDASNRGTVSSDEAGYVKNGYVTEDGYTWWEVDFTDGPRGWCVEQYLDPEQSSGSEVPFEIGERVSPTTALNVRADAGTDTSKRGTVSSDEAGYVKNGYVTEDGYTWWEVDFNDGPRGWCVEQYLDPEQSSGPEVPFKIGEQVTATTTLNVRAQAGTDASKRDTVTSDEAGYVKNGYVTEDGYTWWNVDWTGGPRGWCVESGLEAQRAGNQPAFKIGSEVRSTTSLRVRTEPGTDSTTTDTRPAGVTGFVKNGYVTEDGYTWWEVDWQQAGRGWSVQKYLTTGGSVGDFNQYSDLTRTVTVTGQQIDDAIQAVSPGSPLIGLGDTFVNVQNIHNIDAVYQAAHAAHESAWGRSEIARTKNNLFGWSAFDRCPSGCADSFASYAACVRQVMDFIDTKYLTPGGAYYEGTSLNAMNVHYATDNQWDTKIADIYQGLAAHI